jgi:beta-lactamase class A
MKKILLVSASTFFCFFITLTTAYGVFPPLPLSVSKNNWHPLYDRIDYRLQKKLETALTGNKVWRHLVAEKKMAVGIVDLADPILPRFANVNGQVMMYAASLPKIAILLAAYVSFEDGSLEETPQIHRELKKMIQKSNNLSASYLIDRIGFKKIDAVLQDPRYKLYDKKSGCGGLWVGKRYSKAGKRIPDPICGISHGATATQVCRFYYLLANGKIINPQRSRQILKDLSEPGLTHKFVSVLENRVPLDRIFRKSGTWKTYHSDSVLVWGKVWRRYILVALVDSAKGEQILRDLVPMAENLLRPKDVASVN